MSEVLDLLAMVIVALGIMTLLAVMVIICIKLPLSAGIMFAGAAFIWALYRLR